MPTQKKDQKQYPNLKNQPGYKGSSSDRVGMNSSSDDSRKGTLNTGRERDQDMGMGASHKSSGSQSRSSQSRSSDAHHR